LKARGPAAHIAGLPSRQRIKACTQKESTHKNEGPGLWSPPPRGPSGAGTVVPRSLLFHPCLRRPVSFCTYTALPAPPVNGAFAGPAAADAVPPPKGGIPGDCAPPTGTLGPQSRVSSKKTLPRENSTAPLPHYWPSSWIFWSAKVYHNIMDKVISLFSRRGSSNMA